MPLAPPIGRRCLEIGECRELKAVHGTSDKQAGKLFLSAADQLLQEAAAASQAAAQLLAAGPAEGGMADADAKEVAESAAAQARVGLCWEKGLITHAPDIECLRHVVEADLVSLHLASQPAELNPTVAAKVPYLGRLRCICTASP